MSLSCTSCKTISSIIRKPMPIMDCLGYIKQGAIFQLTTKKFPRLQIIRLSGADKRSTVFRCIWLIKIWLALFSMRIILVGVFLWIPASRAVPWFESAICLQKPSSCFFLYAYMQKTSINFKDDVGFLTIQDSHFSKGYAHYQNLSTLSQSANGQHHIYICPCNPPFKSPLQLFSNKPKTSTPQIIESQKGSSQQQRDQWPVFTSIIFIFILDMSPPLAVLLLTLLLTTALSQFSPLWQSSPYIQSRALIIVGSGFKTTGDYSLPVTYSRSFGNNNNLALSIPQLRILTGGTLGFRQQFASKSATGFTHVLNITGATTIIYYMQARYIVFNTVILGQQFQTAYSEQNNSPYDATISAVTLANNPVCMPFLAGITASSTDNYQVNMTCDINTTTNVRITINKFTTTNIQKISYYVVVWDPVVLAAQSFFFVDYATTTTYYNTQRSPLSLPHGYIDLGYFGGMASFSTTFMQELNFTLSNADSPTSAPSLFTSATSLYDSGPQLQIRVRNCSSSRYPFYSQLDGLCYPICPNYTYTVPSAFLCAACPINCYSCLNGSICTNCSTNMMVDNNVCVCATNSYLSGSTCIGCHYSCLTCVATGQNFNCASCDPANYRQPSSTALMFECRCKTGYVNPSFTAVCLEVCGDGNARTDPCDDNNVLSGDGCSSTCQLEANFTCQRHPTTNRSSCYYTGAVTINKVKIFKDDYSNKFKAYFQITPWIDTMSQLANSAQLTWNTTKITAVDYAVEQGLIVITYTYVEEVMDDVVNLWLRPSTDTTSIWSRLPATNCTFALVSDNGFQLGLYSSMQYQVAGSFHWIAMIMGYLIFASAFLYIFGRMKWIGNLLFLSLQFQYLSMVFITKFTPMLGGLSQIKTVMGYNEIYGQEGFDLPKYSSLAVLNFNKQYDYNVNVMVALQAFGLVMYLAYNITYGKHVILCKKYGGNPYTSYRALSYGKFLEFFSWEFFMFWTIFNMPNQLLATILHTELPRAQFMPLLVFNLLCMLLAVAPLFVRRKDVKSYTDFLYWKDRGHEQSVVSLAAYLLMFALLGIAIVVSPVMYYLLFIFPLAMMVYICCRSPFQSKWMRAAYFVNCFCILIMLVCNLLIIAFKDTVYYLPFGSLITIMVDWIFNLVVWGREAYVICKYGGERDLNEVLASNTKASSNGENFDDFFKDTARTPISNNGSFLNNILKKKTKGKGALSRHQRLDEQTPTGIREERQAKLDEEEQVQREDLKRRKENWMREMKQIKEGSTFRERPRHQIEASALKRTHPKIRTTAQKGVDQAQIDSIL